MRNKLIVGLLVLVVIIAAGVVWSLQASRNSVRRSSIAAVPQAQPVSQDLIASSTTQTEKASPFHFYSPLRDPPPSATPEQLRQWERKLNTTLNNEIKPNLAGPPLANIYAEEAAEANHGDVQAATTLFKGLAYCARETQGPLDNAQELNDTVERMRYSHTDRWGARTANLTAAIAHVQQQYHYCAGLTTHVENRYTISHWARLADQSGDPTVLAWTEVYRDPGLILKTEDMSAPAREAYFQKIAERNQNITKRSAQAGVAQAWWYMWAGYRDGTGGYPIDPVRAYASLYTEYMLTKSPALAYQIWQQSKHLDPLQIQEGEALAHQNYQRIQLE